MLKKLLFVSFVLVCFNTYSAQIDTTIFINNFEKKVFNKFIENKQINPIDLFLAVSNVKSSDNIQNKLDNFYKKLDSENIREFKTKKKLKTIYNSVHDEFLSKYNAETFFEDIFFNGNFNCVSASSLYSLVLKNYNISFEIKETPTHVYIIADPKNTGYLIETTLPKEGFIYFDEKFKKTYVEYLRNNKIISEYEFNQGTTNELFNEHYITDESINLIELGGLQYYNKGIFAFNKEDYKNALINFEKAEILYPSDKIRFLMNGAIGSLLDKENLNKEYHGKLLAKFMNNNSRNSSILKYCEDYFDNLSNEMIMNHPDINKYNEYFRQFTSYIADSVSIDNIYQSYYSFKGYYYYSNFKYYNALLEFENAYKINPSNIRTKQFISEITLKYLAKEGNYESSLDSLSKYTEKFDFLVKNDLLLNLWAYYFAQTVGLNYQNDNEELGKKYLDNFEEFLLKNPSLTVNEEFIGFAYGHVASYYYRKYKYDLAEKALIRGLEISPNSRELKNRMESFNLSRDYYSGYTGKYRNKDQYNNAIKKAKENISKTNQNVTKYIVRKWKLDKFLQAGHEMDVQEDESFIINILKSKNVIFTEGNDHHTGTWSYNNNTCVLKLNDSNFGEYINIVILEITDKKIIGAMYFEDDYSQIADVVFSSID